MRNFFKQKQLISAKNIQEEKAMDVLLKKYVGKRDLSEMALEESAELLPLELEKSYKQSGSRFLYCRLRKCEKNMCHTYSPHL
jgi:hypothetical protein